MAVQADGWTPVYVASRKGHVDAVRALLGAGASVNQADVSVVCVWIGVGGVRDCCVVLLMWM